MHICTLTKLLRLCTPLPPPLPRYPTARAFQRALAPRAPGLDQLAAAAADTGECSKIWDEAETDTDEGPVPQEEEEANEEEGIPGPPLVTSIPGEPTGGKMYWGGILDPKCDSTARWELQCANEENHPEAAEEPAQEHVPHCPPLHWDVGCEPTSARRRWHAEYVAEELKAQNVRRLYAMVDHTS